LELAQEEGELVVSERTITMEEVRITGNIKT